MAYVKFTPNSGDFADEVYFPQVLEGIESDDELIPVSNNVENYDYGEPVERVYYPEIIKRTWIPAMHRRSLDPYDYPPRNYEMPSENDLPFLPPEEDEIPDIPTDNIDQEPDNEISPIENLQNLEEFLPFVHYLNSLRVTPDDIDYLLQPEHSDELRELLNNFFKDYERAQREMQLEALIQDWINKANSEYLKEKLYSNINTPQLTNFRFTRKYNTPDKFRSGWELRDDRLLDNADTSDLFESRVYSDENIDDDVPEFIYEENGSGENLPHQEVFRELQNQNRFDITSGPEFINKPLMDYDVSRYFSGFDVSGPSENKAGVFTEGGVVYVPDSKLLRDLKPDGDSHLQQDINKFFEKYDWGFKRPERLDVKKPGPPFDEHTILTTDATGVSKDKNKVNKENANEIVGNVVKKEPRGAAGHPNPSAELQYAVDTDYVYVGVKDGYVYGF